jgi:glycosyltransferase involved in cell wall biosynthesis
MRILALTFGGATTASSQYRVYQYIPFLQRSGIHVEAFPAATFDAWDTVGGYDAVLVQKKLLPPGRVRWLRGQTRRLLYDVDDAIWFPHGRQHHWLTRWRTGRRLAAIARAADLCIVPNQVLGEYLRRLDAKVALVPMALDAQQWPAKSARRDDAASVRIGWAGSPVNLCYLEEIEPVLMAARRRDPRVQFVVFSGARPRFRELPCEFVAYQPGEESAVIRTFDIGLLPLPGDDFANGKSPIKGLQYMASGVPCVATATAGVRELLGDESAGLLARTDDEWVDAISRLIESPALRRDLGSHARDLFESRYEIRQTAAVLAGLLPATAS